MTDQPKNMTILTGTIHKEPVFVPRPADGALIGVLEVAVEVPIEQVLSVQIVGPTEEIVDDLAGSEGLPVWVLAQLMAVGAGGTLIVAQQVLVRPEVATDA
jgi:hypothetical protein